MRLSWDGIVIGCQVMSGSLDRVALVVQQGLDRQDQLDVFAFVHPLVRFGPFGLNTVEFRLPVTQDVGLHASHFTDFTDLKIQFIRNVRLHLG